MENKIYRVAIVGCGVISANHISALLECDKVEIAALCDIVPERAESRKKEYALNSKIYADYYEMLSSENLDAVHIATPHHLHAEMAIKALDLGINVFLEKPMCINRKQIDDMLAAEKRSSARICVCFQNRFNPSTIKSKEIIAEDGGIVAAYCSVFWNRNEKYYTESGWRGSYATEGGGVMINQAIHPIDLLCQFLGKPETLIATKANHHLKGVIEVEDTCEGLINFDSGRRANFYTTTSYSGSDTTTILLKTKNHTLEIRNNHLNVDYNPYVLESSNSRIIGKPCYGSGHFILVKEFYNALRSGAEMPVTLESAQWAIRILLAAYGSNDQEVEI